jgi:hypothetical protein
MQNPRQSVDKTEENAFYFEFNQLQFSSIFHRKGIFFNSLFKISEFLFQSSSQAGGQEEREAITHVHICD